MIEVSHPGKLYIMGEYSVMKQGHSAVLIPVKQQITGRIEAAHDTSIVTQYGTFKEGYTHERALSYVEYAYQVACDYLSYKNTSINPFCLTLMSDLDRDGKKYGFGSSGVVVVCVLDAILKYHNCNIDLLTLFKLSVLTQKRMGEMSSGGDLATAVYKEPLAYTRYNIECVKHDVSCVHESWDLLEINPIILNFEIAVGWTQSPYKTPDALNHAKHYEALYPEVYATYLDEAQAIVQSFIQNTDNTELIDAYRDWMVSFQRWTHQEIETEALRTLIEQAHELGFRAKVSGAGGGDCGIAIGNYQSFEALYKAWEAHGILPVKI